VAPRTSGGGLRALLAVPGEWVQEFMNMFRFLPEANYRMGCEFAEKGMFRDAIFRMKVALWLNPGLARAWYILGSCLYAQGKKAEAIKALKESLRLAPKSEETLFQLASIDPKLVPEDSRPATMPRPIAIEYFSRVAASYDFQQREMGYAGHLVLDEALRTHLDTRQTNLRLLDLGCGTGLVGFVMADVANYITGVDFCRPMLGLAAKRRRRDGSDAYTRTILRDLREFLGEADNSAFYQVITAAHVFNFVGDLAGAFPGVAKLLPEGGLFAFQVEPYAGKGYGLLPGLGRFGHSEAYIRDLAKTHGLDVLSLKKTEVYPNYKMDQYILKKP
jgi:predicted TPR repeat methyltransferase